MNIIFYDLKRLTTTWIKGRIDKYGFIENQDFVTLHKKVGRAIMIDYHIPIDMAKELPVVERYCKGYFEWGHPMTLTKS